MLASHPGSSNTPFASCYGNWDKLQRCGPLGLSVTLLLMKDLCVNTKSEQHDSLNSGSAQPQIAQLIIFLFAMWFSNNIVIIIYIIFPIIIHSEWPKLWVWLDSN